MFGGLIERIKLLNCTNKLNAVGYIYVPEPDVVLEMPDFFFHTYSVVVYVAENQHNFLLCQQNHPFISKDGFSKLSGFLYPLTL